jgi:hypothetical protein
MLVTSATAIEQTGKVAIGFYGGYSFGFGDVFKKYENHSHYYKYSSQFKVTSSLGAKLKLGLSENIAISFALNYQRTKNEWGFGGEKESKSGNWPSFLVNGILNPMPEGKTCPYIMGGIGVYVYYEEKFKYAETKPGINCGVGVEHFLQDDLELDGGARFHLIFTEDKSTTYIQLYAGLNYFLF